MILKLHRNIHIARKHRRLATRAAMKEARRRAAEQLAATAGPRLQTIPVPRGNA